jgi:hypothetical protein
LITSDVSGVQPSLRRRRSLRFRGRGWPQPAGRLQPGTEALESRPRR